MQTVGLEQLKRWKMQKGEKIESENLFLIHCTTVKRQSHTISVAHMLGRWVLRFLSSETEWEDDAATERISPA